MAARVGEEETDVDMEWALHSVLMYLYDPVSETTIRLRSLCLSVCLRFRRRRCLFIYPSSLHSDLVVIGISSRLPLSALSL